LPEGAWGKGREGGESGKDQIRAHVL
jgi:hypothetical protein